mgnify:CR=1 FL=1
MEIDISTISKIAVRLWKSHKNVQEITKKMGNWVLSDKLEPHCQAKLTWDGQGGFVASQYDKTLSILVL